MNRPAAEARADERGVDEQRRFETSAVSAHYDRCPEAFALVLGKTMSYAAGIFLASDEELDTGQLRKLDYVEEALGLRDGIAVLDVGCGWGNFLLPYAQKFDGRFCGVTLSETQANYVRDGAVALGTADRIQIRVGHIETLEWPAERFDAIIFSGSLIHMHHRADVHRVASRLLRPGGAVFVSDSYVPAARGALDSRGAEFLRTTFGSSRMLSVSEELGFMESAGFLVSEVQDRTQSYVLTLAHWIQNIRVQRTRIDALVPGMAKDFQSYMMLAKHSFQQKSMLDYTIVAHKAG